MPVIYTQPPVFSLVDVLAGKPVAHATPHKGWSNDVASCAPPHSKESQKTTKISPAIDLYDLSTGYVVQASLPGAHPSQIKVDYVPNPSMIVLSGEISRKLITTGASADDCLRVKERAIGRFERKIKLPASVRIAPDEIRAKYINGVLEIFIPKATGPRRRNIPIQFESEAPSAKRLVDVPERVEPEANTGTGRSSTDGDASAISTNPETNSDEAIEPATESASTEESAAVKGEPASPRIKHSVEIEDELEDDSASVLSFNSSSET